MAADQRWLDLNQKFFFEHVQPLLERHFPEEFKRSACLADGMGSDIEGREDELSYDHHVNPRLFVLLSPADYKLVGKRLEDLLLKEFAERLPDIPWESNHYFGHGIVVETIASHFQRFLDFAHPPQTAKEWLSCAEQDLIHLTNGTVYHDPQDMITSLRQSMQYFPDDIWKKKLADYCMQYTLAANFNLNRCVLRGDLVDAQVLRGFGLRRAMDLAHLLNRRYAPYAKWLCPSLRRLPLLSKDFVDVLERIAASNNWDEIVNDFTYVTDLLVAELQHQKLTREIESYHPDIKYGYKLLYIAAWDLLNSLPENLGTIEIAQHQKHSKMNDIFMYRLTRYEMLDHIHAPRDTWGLDVQPR